jgi:hypothetical protein
MGLTKQDSRRTQQRAASAAGGAAFVAALPRVAGVAEALLDLGGAGPDAEPEQEALETVSDTFPVRAARVPRCVCLPVTGLTCLNVAAVPQSVGEAVLGQVHPRDERAGASEPPRLRARLGASAPCAGPGGMSVLAALLAAAASQEALGGGCCASGHSPPFSLRSAANAEAAAVPTPGVREEVRMLRSYGWKRVAPCERECAALCCVIRE